MTYYQFHLNRYQTLLLKVKLFVVYFLLIVPMVIIFSQFRYSVPLLFHASLFFTGWLTWTFGEYMVHRFWQHGENNKKTPSSKKLHQHHHSHPNEIKIKTTHRILLGIIFLVMLGLSFALNNFFTILTGFVFGFMYYTYMHLFLHRRWTAKVFPRLHRFHIYHHCKFPNHCHGISVVWWDLLFKTSPPEERLISEKIKGFYYK